MYIQAPGLIHSIFSAVIHKGVEIIIVRIRPTISAASFWLGKWVDWAVINHVSQGVTSPTDSKIADLVRVSLFKTEITLGRQTMMCSMTQCGFPTGRAGVHWAEEPMVTKIQTNVAAGVGGVRPQPLNQNSGCQGGDPLTFGNLDLDVIVGVYWASSRRGGWRQDVKGQG